MNYTAPAKELAEAEWDKWKDALIKHPDRMSKSLYTIFSDYTGYDHEGYCIRIMELAYSALKAQLILFEDLHAMDREAVDDKNIVIDILKDELENVRSALMYHEHAPAEWPRICKNVTLKAENDHLKNELVLSNVVGNQYEKRDVKRCDEIEKLRASNEKFRRLLNRANGFMECFEKGQKRMQHDLNVEDTLAAVTLYHDISKALDEEDTLVRYLNEKFFY